MTAKCPSRHPTPWPPNPSSQLNVALHDRYALCMYGTQISIITMGVKYCKHENGTGITRLRTGEQDKLQWLPVVPGSPSSAIASLCLRSHSCLSSYPKQFLEPSQCKFNIGRKDYPLMTTYHSGERKLLNKQIGALLILAYLTQSYCARTIAMLPPLPILCA